MTNRDDIMIRLGLDATQMSSATAAQLEAQKKASSDYVAYWNAALKEREAADIKANAESLARLKANDDAKLAETKRFFERQAAMYAERDAVTAIGAGSIPANLAGAAGTVARDVNAAEGAEKELTGLKRAGRGLRELGHIIGDLTGIRIVVPIFRSLASVLKGIAELGGGTFLTSIPIIGTAIAAAVSLMHQRAQLNEMQGAYGTDKNIAGSDKILERDLVNLINRLNRAGLLSSSANSQLMPLVQNGSLDALTRAQGILSRAFPGGVPTEEQTKQAEENRRQMAEIDKEIAAKQTEFQREQLSLQDRYTFDKVQVYKIMGEMAGMDKNSVEYGQKKLELTDAEIQAEQDLLDLNKQKADKQKEQANLQQRYNDLAAEFRKQTDRLNKFGSPGEDTPYMPTLEELASGGGFMTRVKRYQRWLGANSPFKGTARDLVRAQLDLASDVSFRADKDVITGDQDRIRQLRGALSTAGFLPPDQRLAEISDRIQAGNDMKSQIISAALRDGIAIKTGD